MSVNQRINNLLKHGDVQRIADLLSESHANVNKKLKQNKEVDNIWLLLAVARVTDKPLEYFLEDDQNHSDLLNEPVIEYGFNKQRELIEENKALKKELSTLKDKIRELQGDLIIYLKKG
jgi:hypothetical protein